MRIGIFIKFCLIVAVLGLGLLMLLSSQALSTLDETAVAEQRRHRSLKLANELFQSSEDLTKMARSYVITGNPVYERLFLDIHDIRNGIRSRPKEHHLITYWEANRQFLPGPQGDAISLMDLMRREGFSELELELLRQSQKNSDSLVNLEKQAFAAIKGLYDDGYGNYTVSRTPDRDFAINLLFGEHYNAQKSKIMIPISEFITELDHRNQAILQNLQSKYQKKVLLILGLLCTALLGVAAAAVYMRRNILLPLDYLSHQARCIAEGSYSSRCDLSTHNEIAELGSDFNTMAETIEYEIMKLKQVEEFLRERLKEINCFYAIHRGMESRSLEDVCRTLFVHLVAAMQFPHHTNIRIELDDEQFISDQYNYDKDHAPRLQKQIVVYGKVHGWITIFYGEDYPFLLPYEQNLIDAIGDDLGRWLEHKQAEARILIEQELRVHDTMMREFAAHVEWLREEDRKYIAREIHDELGQLLAALHLELSLLKNVEDNKKRVGIIRCNMVELLGEADRSVHSVAEHLRPASLELGIISALKKLTDEFRKHSGINCVLELMKEPINLNENQTVAIFRIVQESLTNVARHAKASRVGITLSQCADDLIIEVRDNGKGFNFAETIKKKSFGLLGIRERAVVLEGSIDITSVPQQGTVVSVRIPIKRNEGVS